MESRSEFEILDATLHNLLVEIQLEKTTIRNKAFGVLQDFLDRRSDEINNLVNPNNYASDTKWPSIFMAVLEGMNQHVFKIRSAANTSTLENKCGMYEHVMTRVLGVANANNDQIPKNTLLEKCLEAVEKNQEIDKYFGVCLFTIINQYVVLSKTAWKSVKSGLYNQYLSVLFKIVEKSGTDDFYVNCLRTAIEVGIQHLNVSTALEGHLIPMLAKTEGENSEMGKMNLSKIVYLIAFETIVNKRVVTCELLFGWAKGILGKYNHTRIRDEYRTYIIKMLDLIVVAETVTDDPKALSQQDWNTFLQGCTYIVEQEIDRMDRNISYGAVSGSATDAIFMDFAARVCALTFWDDNIWMSSSGSPQPQKRMKYLGKYQALISRTEATSSNARQMRKYSWRWMLILGKVLQMYPERVEQDDYETILQLLTEFQPQIQKPEQFQGFYLACQTLLAHQGHSESANQKKIADLWHKIVETAARNCSSINQASHENLMLIRLILKYKQHKGEIFIESLLDTYFTNSVNRSNESIQTLIALMLTFNINILKDPSDKVEKILSYLLLKQRVNAKISILKSQEKPKPEFVARLIVLCNMYKSTVSEIVKEKWLDDALEYGQEIWVNEEYKKYKTSINSIKESFLIQLLQKPIFTESDIDHAAPISSKSLSFESMCVIDDKSFGSFCAKIMPIESQMACSQNADDQEDVPDLMEEKLYNTAILVNAFDMFIKIRAWNLEKVSDFQLVKRIGIIVATLEQDFGTLDGSERFKPKSEMLKILLEILGTRYHEAVLCVVRGIPWTNCFNWIAKIIEQGTTRTGDLEPDKRLMLKQLSLTILAAYLCTEGLEIERAQGFFSKCLEAQSNVLNVCDVNDIHVFLDVLSTLVVSKRKSNHLAHDITTFTMELLHHHYHNTEVIDKFVSIVPNFLSYFKESDPQRITEVTTIFKGLLKAAKSLYPLPLILKILALFKYFVREYPSSSSLKDMCDLLYDFTNAKCLRTRIASSQAFIYMIHPTWSQNANTNALQDLDELFKDICEDNLKDFRAMDDPDKKASNMAISTQLYCTTVCVSYQLRHKAILAFLDMCDLCQPSYEREFTMKEFFKRLDNAINCNIYRLFQDDMKRLLSHWVVKDYQFPKFPYYITGATSLDDFFTANMATMSIAIFTSNEAMLPKLCQSTKKTEEELLRDIIPDLMIELLPILSKPGEPLSTQKGVKARTLIGKVEQLPNYLDLLKGSKDRILELLIQRFFDNEFIKAFLNTTINSGNDTTDFLSHQELNSCCEYLKCIIQSDNSSESTFVKMCDRSPYAVQKLLLSIELRLASVSSHEQQIVCLSQYIWIFEQIKLFIAHSAGDATVKDFFIINMVHVICDQINSPIEVVSNAAFFYFQKVCEQLAQSQAKSVAPCLTFIVYSLVVKIVSTDNSEMISFLQKLLIDNQSAFTSEIILLPDFPNKPQFKTLQEHVTAVRNAMQQNTLLAQIEQFFNIQYMTVETLKSLHTSLATRKPEVVEMYDKAKKIRFSDEANESILHRLVTKLVSLVEGLDTAKAYEASRCLGELGAANLNTVALYDQSEHICYKTAEKKELALEEALDMIHHELFQCLKDAIVDKDVKLKFVANEAAFKLMHSALGRKFLAEFPLFESFMDHPKPKIRSIITVSSIDKTFLSNIFIQTRSEEYKTWMQKACMQFLRAFNDNTIVPLVLLKPDFAENLLPTLVKLCLAFDNSALLTELNNEMQSFFLEFYGIIKTSTASKFYRDKSIVKTMLMLFECCRVEDRIEVAPRIKIDYLHLVKAAEFCNASFSCILYSQLWSSKEAASARNGSTFFDVKGNNEVCSSLRNAFKSVGVQDAEHYLLDPLRDRQLHLIANGAWEQTLLEQTHFDWDTACREALHQNGFYELATTVAGTKHTQERYEMAWRLSDWSLFDEKDHKDDLNVAFERSHYEALKCLHVGDKTGILRNVRSAREIIVQILKTTATECPRDLYRCFALLELLQQIDDVTAVRFDKQDHEILLSKWNTNDMLPQTEFKLTELKLSQRVAVQKGAGKVANRTWLEPILPKTMFAVIEAAISAGRDNIALKNIAGMKAADIDRKYQALVSLEDAKLNMKHNNTALGRVLLEKLLDNKDVPLVIIESCYLLGCNNNSSVDDPMKTYKDFFLKSHRTTMVYAKRENKLDKLKQGIYDDDEHGRQLKAISPMFGKIAKFFDKQYVEVNNYLKSPDYLKRQSVIERQEFSCQALREKNRTIPLVKEERTQLMTLEVNIKADKARIVKYHEDRDTYLANALRYYAYACRYSDIERLHVFRIVSLFLSHKSSTAVRKVMVGEMPVDVPEEENGSLFDSLPAYMFLDILPQLSAHMYNETESTYVDTEIYKLLKRCALMHPHHTLSHIMSMSNSYADTTDKQSDSRTRGAAKLLRDIKQENPKLNDAVDQLANMSSVLIKMANTKLRESAGTCELTKKNGCGMMSLSNLTAVHCPTLHLPIMKSGNYDDVIVTIQKWNSKVAVLNGINAPKKFECVCSDGIERPQLLKGKDDLRQDAVMQQVFNIMNTMLAQNPKSAERRLQVRTYKVIPFSRRSGMLEWCHNTIPLGNILLSCHKKYRPYDKLTPADARNQIQHSDPKNKLKTFKEICKQLKPAFHHFFLEHFLTPGALFERQYAYTNSVATNSIIGYILGIGDRHVQNILLDYTTTEVVHIDFGIAFEQGKCLLTPETIPFRLTRDIVAGMGVTGVEGVFRKSSEITMQVLRDNQHTILAILQVLLYDPLYLWTLTPEKARRTQSLDWEPDLVSNTSAERALELSKEKLNGGENILAGLSTIEDQVDKLIREATASKNLCKVFHGWQAYL